MKSYTLTILGCESIGSAAIPASLQGWLCGWFIRTPHPYKMIYRSTTHWLVRVMGIPPKHDISFLSLKDLSHWIALLAFSGITSGEVQLYFFKINLYYKFSF